MLLSKPSLKLANPLAGWGNRKKLPRQYYGYVLRRLPL
jgi:hypothetical protein